MAYAPINLQIYTAAYCGAFAAMALSGKQIISVVATDYTDETQIAGAYAQQFDIVWNSAADANGLQVQSAFLNSYGYFQERDPHGQVSALPANFNGPAQAIIASIAGSSLYYAAQGITPPPYGGGGSSTLPAAPSTDGTYLLKVLAGVASWLLTGFAPTLALASGGAGPFVCGITWTPTFNGNPAPNNGSVTAYTISDNQGHGPTSRLGSANPFQGPVASYAVNDHRTVSVTGSVTEAGSTVSTNAVSAVFSDRTFSGLGGAGATSAVANGTNADLVGGGGNTLAGTATAIANPVGQVIGTFNPTNQKLYDLCVHTATPHTYTDGNNQPVLMGPGGNGVPITFNFTNENGIVESWDLYETSNLLTGNIVVTRH